MTIIFHEGRKDRHLPRLNKIKSLRRAIIYSQKSLHNQDEYPTFVPKGEEMWSKKTDFLTVQEYFSQDVL